MTHKHNRHIKRKTSTTHELPVQLEHYIVQYTQEGLSESSQNIKSVIDDASKSEPLVGQVQSDLIQYTQEALNPVLNDIEAWYEEFRETQGASSQVSFHARRDNTIQGSLKQDLKANFKPVVSRVESWYDTYCKTHSGSSALDPNDITINDMSLETFVKGSAVDSMKNAMSKLVSSALDDDFSDIFHAKLIKRAARTTSSRSRATRASSNRERERASASASQRSRESRLSRSSRERAAQSTRTSSRAAQTTRQSSTSARRTSSAAASSTSARSTAAATGASSSSNSVNKTTVPVVTVTASPTNSSANANSVHAQNSKSSLSSGAIAGIVVGSVVGAILLCALLYFGFRKKNDSGNYDDGLYDDPSNPAYFYENKKPEKKHRRGGPEPSLFGSLTGPIVDDVDGYGDYSRGTTPNVPHYADVTGSSQSTFDEKNNSYMNPGPVGNVAPVALPTLGNVTNPQATTGVQFTQQAPPPVSNVPFNSLTPAAKNNAPTQSSLYDSRQNLAGRALSATRGPVPMPAPGDPTAQADTPEDTYIIVRTFEPSMPDELHVQPGDRVQLFTTYDDGWALGIDIDAPSPMKGVFPCDCIAIDEDTDYMHLLTSQRRSSMGR